MSNNMLKQFSFTARYSYEDECWIAECVDTTWLCKEKTPEKAISSLQSLVCSIISQVEAPRKREPNEIVEILHSITDIIKDDSEICVKQLDDKHYARLQSFEPNSFTRRLLSFIQDYLFEEE